MDRQRGSLENYAFPSRIDRLGHFSTRQYAKLVEEWVSGIGLRKEDYEHRVMQTPSMRFGSMTIHRNYLD